MVETGHFATLWKKIATRCLVVEFIPGDWRRGASPSAIGAKRAEDKEHQIKVVMVVHNETSTGATGDIAAIRAAIDAAGHRALPMADTISSLASIDYRHDEWRVNVTVSRSQKGLMLPPGLAFNAISEKALSASGSSRLPHSY
jgi:alanine-glyoxylate transaminase/serine-glyoxylate transaminase/serine-pyruvate transaminase